MRQEPFYILIWFVSFLAGEISGQHFSYPVDNPVELGKVNWLRDYEKALRLAKDKKLPVFILFQEVPGCSNCTTFGNEILSNPLLVEAIESCFVPLCIYNNAEGKDRNVLNKYNEPTWNNPVVRITDSNGLDIVPRQPDFRKMSKTLTVMKDGIKKSGYSVPAYLDLLSEEVGAEESSMVSEIYFSMYCFWSGEKEIAGIDGVVATEAGFMSGKEVVKIKYRSDKITPEALFTQSKKVGCGDEMYGNVLSGTKLKIKPLAKYKKDSEDKYYLFNSEYKIIPMTSLQKTKVNRLLALGQKPDNLLSRRQLSVLRVKNNKSKNHIADSIEEVWWK